MLFTLLPNIKLIRRFAFTRIIKSQVPKYKHFRSLRVQIKYREGIWGQKERVTEMISNREEIALKEISSNDVVSP